MELLTKEALVFFRPVKSLFKSYCRAFMINKDSMSTKVEQNSELDDENQGTCTDLIISSRVTTVTRSASLHTASKSEVANSQNPCPTLGDRTDLQRLPEQTKQGLFNESVCTRCTGSSSESELNSWFDIYEEKQMQHKITNAQVELNLPNDDTSLVDGLLTTTLCSTEL